MTDTNHVVLIGRVTKDAESKQVGNTTLANVSIAVNRSIKKGDQWENEASFFDVLIWKPSEWLLGQLKKGKQICVDGYLKQDRWEKDGQKFSKVSVVSNQTQVLGSGNKDAGSTNEEGFPEDCPF